jgi:hypothetical protein
MMHAVGIEMSAWSAENSAAAATCYEYGYFPPGCHDGSVFVRNSPAMRAAAVEADGIEKWASASGIGGGVMGIALGTFVLRQRKTHSRLRMSLLLGWAIACFAGAIPLALSVAA